jgi:heptosyltransferase II
MELPNVPQPRTTGNLAVSLKALVPMATQQLVILAPNWLGDAVMALPAMADVRRALPDASISVAARPAVLPLFTLVGGIDRTIPVKDMRGRGFDAALLLPNSFHSALIAYRAGIPERWGYRTDWRAPLLTRAVPPVRGVHQIAHYQRLTAALGFENGSDKPHLEAGPPATTAAATLLTEAGWNSTAPLVALAPGAAFGGAKRWPPEYFAELADALGRDGVVSVLVGSGADASTGRQVEAAVSSRSALLNLIGRTDLPTLAGVLVHARTLVTNDSGAMHIAAALDVPVTAIFGPTREDETAPASTPSGGVCTAISHRVITNPVSCRPCMLRECPLDHACMRGILPHAVLDAARRTL